MRFVLYLCSLSYPIIKKIQQGNNVMEILKTVMWIMQITSAIIMIVLVLLQHGKGADAGATFGSGSSGSLFGANGSANFLSRATAVFAVIFFTTTFGLVYISSKGRIDSAGVMANMNGKVITSDMTPQSVNKINSSDVIGVNDKSNNKITSSAPNQIPN